jgi:2-hydroxychromene-2-carboxylate isomerase
MTISLDFCFDFASPNAYFAYKVAPNTERAMQTPFNYIPVLLGGIFKACDNQAPMLAFAHIKNKPDYERLEIERFIAKHQLDKFNFNPDFPINTLQLMRGALVAKDEGFLPAYMDAVFHHMWEAPKKMDDLDVIIAALNESGLEGEHIMERSQETGIKKALIDNTNSAVERGSFGIPTYFVNNDIYYGKDRLRDVEEAVIALKAAVK